MKYLFIGLTLFIRSNSVSYAKSTGLSLSCSGNFTAPNGTFNEKYDLYIGYEADGTGSFRMRDTTEAVRTFQQIVTSIETEGKVTYLPGRRDTESIQQIRFVDADAKTADVLTFDYSKKCLTDKDTNGSGPHWQYQATIEHHGNQAIGKTQATCQSGWSVEFFNPADFCK